MHSQWPALLDMWIEPVYKTVVNLNVLRESFRLPDFEAHSMSAFPGLLVVDGAM